MKSSEIGKNTAPEKYMGPFSLLATAANVMIKVKPKINFEEEKNVNLKKKDNFQLGESIKYSLEIMKKEFGDKPSVSFKDLFIVLQSPHFQEFLQHLLNYFKELFGLEERIGKSYEDFKHLPKTEIFDSEKKKLIELAKKVGVHYSWILVCFIQQRNAKQDSHFFETMLTFCQKVLQPAFDEKWHKLFEDEVNRLFRTNEFNVSVHLKSLRFKQKNGDKKFIKEELRVRPFYSKSRGRLHKSTNRSPLVSLLFPSGDDQMRMMLERKKEEKKYKEHQKFIKHVANSAYDFITKDIESPHK